MSPKAPGSAADCRASARAPGRRNCDRGRTAAATCARSSGSTPGVVLIEDDYVAAVAGAPYVPLHEASPRWTVIRSVSKVLGPDLRIAAMAGDPLTISQVEGRQLLGPGWVSHLLQQTAANVWEQPATRELLARAERSYGQRRTALVGELAGSGIPAFGRSGLGVWVPLAGEVATVQQLLERGWAVSPGERFRFRAGPGIRITTASLALRDVPELAAHPAGRDPVNRGDLLRVSRSRRPGPSASSSGPWNPGHRPSDYVKRKLHVLSPSQKERAGG